MADVTGPISTLAGTSHGVPEDATCDNHPDRKSVVRIQGETDSFGCEMIDYCQQCWDEHLAYRKSPEGKAEEAESRTGRCEWCKGRATDLRDARDYDEGLYGPVYRVCGACIRRRNERAAAELDEWEDQHDGDDWDLENESENAPPARPLEPAPAVILTRLRKSTLIWSYHEHWSGERASFVVCGLHVSVVDMDGDRSVWEIRKGKGGAVLRSGQKECGVDDFVDCAADAETALRAIITERIAELRSARNERVSADA